MRSVVLPLASLVVAACASSGTTGGAPPAPDQTVRVVGVSGTSSVTMSGNDVSNVRTIAHTVNDVWLALPMVFDSLGIPVQTLDPVKHSIGNPAFAVRHRLKNVPLSRYIDCGGGQMGPVADDYDVSLSALADVRAGQGSAATVTFTLEAAAKPPNYSQAYSRCGTRGTLEDRFFSLLNARLAR